MSLFGIDIASQVSSAFSGQLVTGTLTRRVQDDYDALSDTQEVNETSYSFDGLVEMYSDYMYEQGLVKAKDRKILIIAGSLEVSPTSGAQSVLPDKITVEGQTYTVVGIPERDPAGATWIVQGRL